MFGADIPSDLAPFVAAMQTADAAHRDAACDRLIDAYLPRLRAGQSLPLVDEAIAAAISPESRANIAALLAAEGVFSSLQRACIAHNDASELDGVRRERAEAAKGLYRSLSLLAESAPRDAGGWKAVASDLRAGWRFYPSQLYADRLDEALRRAGDRRGVFEFRAYRYMDESGAAPLRWLGLVFRWLLVPDRGGFDAELTKVKKTLKEDILLTSPSASFMPRFGADIFSTAAGAPRTLDFNLPGSPLFHKRAVFIFFETTCGFCDEELRAWEKVAPRYLKANRDRLAIIGLKLPSPLPGALNALGPFEKRFSLPFPLLENDKSEIREAYHVRAVPLLVFFDEQGFPLWSVSFRGTGHLEEKLSWFLDDLLAASPAQTER